MKNGYRSGDPKSGPEMSPGPTLVPHSSSRTRIAVVQVSPPDTARAHCRTELVAATGRDCPPARLLSSFPGCSVARSLGRRHLHVRTSTPSYGRTTLPLELAGSHKVEGAAEYGAVWSRAVPYGAERCEKVRVCDGRTGSGGATVRSDAGRPKTAVVGHETGPPVVGTAPRGDGPC